MIIKELEKEDYLEKKLSELEKNGSDKIELLKLKKEAFLALKKEKLNTSELLDATYGFVNAKNIHNVEIIRGLSSGIFTDKSSISFYAGNSNNNESISENTLFDVASITKLYTLVLTFKLIDLCYFNLNDKIKDLDSRFNLGDFTILDLLSMHGELFTNGLIKNANSSEEAMKILETVSLKSDRRDMNNYTDIGAIILSKIIEKKVSEKFSRKFTHDEIMAHFIFKRYDLNQTTYQPNTLNLAGNGNINGTVHDPKAKILGPVGSAGIFTTVNDIALFARNLYDLKIISQETLNKFGTKLFSSSNKGLMGLYQRELNNLENTYTPGLFSNRSFSHQGWTGSVTAIDPKNKINLSILVNAIPLKEVETKNDKVIGFRDEFIKYEEILARTSLIMKILEDYLKEEPGFTKIIKL